MKQHSAESMVRPETANASPSGHDHANVLGIEVSAVNMQSAVDTADLWIAAKQPGYVCVIGVHGVMEAQRDPLLQKAMNGAAMNTPDGMPMSWVGRIQGFREMDRVFGPDFMLKMCELSLVRGYRHFLFGGQEGVAEELQSFLEAKFPGIQVVGTFTPPFRPMNAMEESALMLQVRKAEPHIFWVGLSTPKQERFMAHYVHRLQVPLMVGVGAAFDFHTGRLRDCPDWMKRSGMQWFHRLLQEPRRLWRRYLRNNPAFLWKITLQLLTERRGRTTPAAPDAKALL